MRIVAWNCAKAFHKKIDRLLALRPDVAVVSECAEPEVLARKCRLPEFAAPPIWHGSNPNWGLGVFFFNKAAGRCHDGIDSDLPGIIPVEVTAPRRFNLLAVWAPTGLRKEEPGPVREAIEIYRGFLTEEDAVVAGDFNHNAIWDKPGWANNHRDAVNILDGFGLASAYHAQTGEDHGEETVPTFHLFGKKDPPYHIDYIFVPRAWTERTFNLQIGQYDDWIAPGTGMNGKSLSDHVPLTFVTDDG